MANRKIMVVDDSPIDTHFICSVLTSAGYIPVAIANANEVLQVAKEVQPEAILMDVVMPGINGYQAIRKICSDPLTSGIPVIIVSSKNKTSDRVWGLRQGAMGYVTKPISSSELLKTLREHIPLAS